MKLMCALVIDASWDTRREVVKLLDEAGFDSVEAEDGISALQFASPDAIDLIVVDPRFGGLKEPQFLQLVVNGAFGKSPPPLIICAEGPHSSKWAPDLTLSGLAMLPKPFTPRAFTTALDAAFPFE